MLGVDAAHIDLLALCRDTASNIGILWVTSTRVLA
jgi:hypothetical protein